MLEEQEAKLQSAFGIYFAERTACALFREMKVWSFLMSVREHAHEAKRDGYERDSYTHAFARKIYEKMKELDWKIMESLQTALQTNIHDLSRIDPQIMQKNAKDRVFVFPALCKIAECAMWDHVPIYF